MIQVCVFATSLFLALAFASPRPAAHAQAARPAARLQSPAPAIPDWSRAASTGQASANQAFLLDGLAIAISRISSAAQFPDGTPPDSGAQIVEVEFWARNPQNESADFFERFYPYAELSDGSNTDGEGVSFYALTGGSELGQLTLRPNDLLHARFYLEIPQNTSMTQLVIFGPLDGVKTILQAHTSAQR